MPFDLVSAMGQHIYKEMTFNQLDCNKIDFNSKNNTHNIEDINIDFKLEKFHVKDKLIRIYNDGSKLVHGISSAFVVYNESFEKIYKSYKKLSNESNIFMAEMIAI